MLTRGGKNQAAKRVEKPVETDLEKRRTEHKNAYRPWTSAEESELKQCFDRGDRVKDMAERLGREPGAIRARIKKLGLKEI